MYDSRITCKPRRSGCFGFALAIRAWLRGWLRRHFPNSLISSSAAVTARYEQRAADRVQPLMGGILSLLSRNSFPAKSNPFPATAEQLPCSGGIQGLFARRRRRFLSRFPPVRLPDA